MQSRIDSMPCRYVSHPRVPESGVAGLEFCYQPVDFLLKCFGLGTGEDLISLASSQPTPIHPVHRGIEVLRFHQPADLVENLRAFVQRQVHCSLILIGVDASPIATNPAQ